MRHCRKTLPLLFVIVFVALEAQGQITSSPFSEIGIGNLHTNANAQNQGMGGIGISNASSWYINTINPALLVFNHVTVFQAGMEFEKKSLSDGTSAQKFQNGNLNYLAIAFPVKTNRWTTSFGLAPYSSVNYNYSRQEQIEGSNQIITYQQVAKGGINQLYWANGVSINKYFSLGLKATYLFGSVVTQNPSYSPIFYANAGVSVKDAYGGLNLSGGFSFHIDSLWKKDFRIKVGLIGSLGSDLSLQHKVTYQSLSNGAYLDSASYPKQYGKMTLPSTYGIGASFGKSDRWMVGFDFNYLDYKTFDARTNDGNQQYQGVPTIGYRTGFGVEVIPKVEDFTSYLKRVTYRAGFSYEKSPFLVNGNALNDIGGTFGFSLPVGQISTVDLGIKIGKRGVIAQNWFQEDYFRIYFGVTFNDRFWFIKRKFD